MRRCRTRRTEPTQSESKGDRRQSEDGDTLVEILITLTVAGVALIGLLAAFAAAIAGSGEHRMLATMDSMLRTAAAEVTSTMQQQSSSTWASCSGASQVGSIPLPVAGYSAKITQVQFQSANPSPAMLATDTWQFSAPQAPGTACASPNYQYSPQQLTITVSTVTTSGSITTVVDDPVTPNTGTSCPNPASKLVWVQQPTSGIAGSPLFPAATVLLEDSTGCVVQNDLSQVQLSITPNSGTAGATLSNCAASPVYGETTFQNCAINTIGQNYTLTASDPTDAGNGVTPIVSNAFSISAGVPVQLAFTTQPGNGTGGSALSTQPSVTIEDAAGNPVQGDSTSITLAIGTNPANGSLSGCTSTTTNGVATFSGCKIDKAGTGYTLTATDPADNLTTPSSPSSAFNITVGSAAQLGFTTNPGTTIAGDKLFVQPVVAVQDLGGNTVTTNTSTVSLAIGTNPSGGTLSGCTSSRSAGVTSFANCSINNVGTGYTLKATDGLLTPATSAPFNMVAPALTSFSVVPSTTNATAGTAFTLTLTALDQSGATFPGLTGVQTISFSGPSNSPNGRTPSYPATVSFAGGVGTASVTLFDAQTTTILAADGAATGTSSSISVHGLTSTSSLFLSNPGTVSAGTMFNQSVTAVDQYGNTASGYRGTVRFTSTDARAALPANYTFSAGDAGSHVFSVTLKTPGTQSITATDTVTGSITGTQSGIPVIVGPTSQLVVSGFTTPTTAGAAHNVTVSAEDAAGDVTPAYSGTVHFTSTDAQATLPANYTFSAGDAGTHVFSVTLKTAGTESITATDTVTGSITGTQSAITVNAAATSQFVVSGYPSPTVAGVAHTVTVSAQDTFGNVTTGYRGTVHLTSSDAQATLPANYTFSAGDAGTHTFSVTLKTAGTQSITATDTVTGSITGTQGAITVNPAAASTLSVSGYPSPTTAGVAHTETVSALDAFGNVASGYTGTVRFTSTDARAVLPANYTFSAGDAGSHVFSVTLKTPGTQSITATDTVTGSITGTQGAITITVGATAQFVVSGYPTPTTAGVAHTVTVSAEDAAGNVTPAYTGTVTLTSSDAQATLPANYTFSAGDAGTHVFSVTLKTAGTQSITATDTVTGSITGTQSAITVNPATTSTLSVSGYPSPTVAGVAHTVTVSALDAFGNVATSYRGTVHLTSSDAQATLPANYTFSAGDNGTHTFSVTLKTAGTQSITATDTVTGSITGTQSAITVNPAATAQLVVSGFTTPTTAGAAHNVTVSAEDTFGNVTPAYSGTVHFTSTDAQATLPANYTFSAGDAGTHVFSVTLKTAGTESITATDTVTGSITGTQSAITVNAAATSQFVVSGYPSPTVAGVAHTVTVSAQDTFGNVTTGYRGTVHLTSSDAQATLPANYTFSAGDAGTHTFSVTLKTAGTQSITATDTVTGSITGTQGAITVNPAAASTLSVSGYPSPTTAGVAHTETVSALDAFGNVASGYTGTVRFTSTDARAVLPANYTFSAGDAGSHVFSVTLKTPGTQSITATDTVTGSITGTQGAITITVGATAQFVVSGYPTPTTAGVAHTVTVSAEDAAGNVTPAYTGTVTLTSSDAQATLPANYTFSAGDAGTHVFSVTLKTAGTQSITATDTVTGSITGTQSAITVNPATTSTLSVSGYPSPTAAGVAHTVTVSALDAFGNVATSYRGTVHLTSSDAQATLPANYTFSAGDNGTHTFSVTLKTAGTESITATDTVTGSITGTQSAITVNPAATAQLVVSGFTTPTTAGAAHNVTVSAEDTFGNVTPAYSGTVHFTSTDAQATLPANYTFSAGDAGTHVFSVTLKTAGTESITATDTVTGSITGTQSAITVNAAALAGIGLTGITQQPTPVVTPCTGAVGNLQCTSSGEGADNGIGNAGARTVTASITLEDQFGNAVTNAGSSITINLASSGSVQPLNHTTLTIPNGASTTSSSFTFIRSAGTGLSANLTANMGGPTELTITLSS